MSKPKRIILVRHGQSSGNINSMEYSTVQDHLIPLTEKGILDASQAGLKVKEIIGKETWGAYNSPFVRTRQTFEALSKQLHQPQFVKEEPRIREQDWGHFKTPAECGAINYERDLYGSFFYRIANGESGADVYDRVSTFFDTMYRDFEKDEFPENCLLTIHGMTLRILCMRFFHNSVEEFQSWKNPTNGEVYVLELQDNNKYKLITPFRVKTVKI